MKYLSLWALVAMTSAMPALSSFAAYTYSSAGSTYGQNFNGLSNGVDANGTTGAWSNDTTLPGWHFANMASLPVTQYTIYDGSTASQGSLLSLGAAGDPDRALGFQSSGSTGTAYYGVSFANNTSQILRNFSVQYTGELWRVISSQPAEKLTVQYQIFNAGAGSITASSGWISASSLDFTTPYTSASTQSLNGNTSTYRTTVNSTISGITWANGQELWIRWADNSVWSGDNATSTGLNKLGIDDFTFVATVPEPSRALLLLSGSLLFFGRRRQTSLSV